MQRPLALAIGNSPELDVDPEQDAVILVAAGQVCHHVEGMVAWRKRLFIWMVRATANPAEDLHLPPERTVVIGARIELEGEDPFWWVLVRLVPIGRFERRSMRWQQATIWPLVTRRVIRRPRPRAAPTRAG